MNRPTQRQAEVLECLTLGFSVYQIAEALSISERTVQRHLYDLKRKFACETLQALVVIAVKCKIMDMKLLTKELRALISALITNTRLPPKIKPVPFKKRKDGFITIV